MCRAELSNVVALSGGGSFTLALREMERSSVGVRIAMERPTCCGIKQRELPLLPAIITAWHYAATARYGLGRRPHHEWFSGYMAKVLSRTV